MKVTLIKPPILHKGASFALMPSPPLGLAYIAGAIKALGHQVQVIDCSAEGYNDIEHFNKGVYVFGLNKEKTVQLIEPDTDVICFSFMFTNNWLYDKELLKEVKANFPDAILIAGGEHVNAVPERTLMYSPLNYIVLGEGEETIADLIMALSENKNIEQVKGIVYKNSSGDIVKNSPRKRIKNVDEITWPAWELFPLQKYFQNKISYGVFRGNTLPVMATRGCPYTCTFCSNPQMWGRSYEVRSPKLFVDELEFLYNNYQVKNFDFFDLTAIIFKKWIVEMCQEIIDRGLDITYQLPSGTRAEAIDFEVASLLYKSGCKNITYAPESGSKKVLRDVKKKVKTHKMLESIRHSNKAGMNIKLNMIIGFPEDTHKDIWQTIWFLIKCSWNGAHDTAPAVFSPYPGSELFNQLQKEGKVSLDSDDYIYEIIESYDLWPSKTYAKYISPFMIKFYVFAILFTFYTSNFIFRPVRLFRLIRNIIMNREESRLEQVLRKNFLKNFLRLKLE